MTRTAAARRLVSLPEYMDYIGLGRNKAREFGEEIGAAVRIGRAVRYDLEVTSKYLDKITGQSGSNSAAD